MSENPTGSDDAARPVPGVDQDRIRAEFIRRVRAGEEPTIDEIIEWAQRTPASPASTPAGEIEIEGLRRVPSVGDPGPARQRRRSQSPSRSPGKRKSAAASRAGATGATAAAPFIDASKLSVQDQEAVRRFVEALADRGQHETTISDRLGALVEHSPWWLLSLALHLLVFAILALIIVFRAQDVSDLMYRVAIVSELEDEQAGVQLEQPSESDQLEDQEPEPEPEPVPEPEPTPEEAPVVVEDQPTSDAEPTKMGPEPAPPTESAAGLASLRSSGKDRLEAIARFGGNADTEAAVSLGLDWLARHQERDGSWSASHFADHCKRPECKHTEWKHPSCHSESCTDPSCAADSCISQYAKERYCTHVACKAHYCKDLSCWGEGHEDISEGITGLALLAFLGAGHTHLGHTAYRDVVARTVQYVKNLQSPSDGCFEPRHGDSGYIYEHAILTLALAESYALTGDESLRLPVERGVEFLVHCQQAKGGWDYTEYTETQRNDTSITGWVVMALKSARIGGIDVPDETWKRVSDYMEAVTLRNGEVIYADRDPGPGRKGIGMTAVALLCRLYLGESPTRNILRKMTRLLVQDPPNYDHLFADQYHTMYYWYYGTLALFQVGGNSWAKWNGQMRDTLVAKQVTIGHAAGSWDPDGPWLGRYSGRLYSTTLCVLNLEIYYRYLPIYKDRPAGGAWAGGADADGDPDDAEEPDGASTEEAPTDAIAEAIELASSSISRHRARAVRTLVEAGDTPEAIRGLLLYLDDDSPTIRWQAIGGLRDIQAKEAVMPLIARIPAEKPFLQELIVDALGEIGDDRALPALASLLAGGNRNLDPHVTKALRLITGQDLGADRGLWQAWLEANDHR